MSKADDGQLARLKQLVEHDRALIKELREDVALLKLKLAAPMRAKEEAPPPPPIARASSSDAQRPLESV